MNERQGWTGAAAAALGGAALLGLSPIGVRLSELGPQATNLWRFLFALPILAVWALASRRTPSAGQTGWLLLAGLLFGFEISLWAEALSHTTVANATLLSNMTPIFAAAFAWFVFKERPRAGVFWGGAIALTGAVTLAFARASTGAGPAQTVEQGWYGDALGFASAVGYAGYLLIVRHLGGRVSTGAVMLIATAAAAGYALCLSLALGEQLLPQTLNGWLVLLGLGVVVQAGAQGLIAFGVARLPIAASTVMLWMQPTTAAIWSWMLFSEALGPLALCGAALVLAGVFLVQRARG
ncbi:MAG: DMT family transporter [Hyphomonadaceae bacterium]|nr:DMT family transporter [Hyphomonadaceae bacterium]